LSLFVFGLTLLWPRWIELIFDADPDGGSGQLEALIVFVSIAVVLCGSVLARRDRRGSLTKGASLPVVSRPEASGPFDGAGQ
jgi:hypothetical protein